MSSGGEYGCEIKWVDRMAEVRFSGRLRIGCWDERSSEKRSCKIWRGMLSIFSLFFKKKKAPMRS